MNGGSLQIIFRQAGRQVICATSPDSVSTVYPGFIRFRCGRRMRRVAWRDVVGFLLPFDDPGLSFAADLSPAKEAETEMVSALPHPGFV